MRILIAIPIIALIFTISSSTLNAQTTPPPAYLYLLESNGTNLGTLHVFTVNPTTGALAEVSGSPFNAGLNPQQILIAFPGSFIYVINQQSQDITGLAINPSTGALTPLPGSPFPIGSNPVTAGVDPTGRFLYVFATSPFSNTADEYLYEYAIDSSSGFLTLTSSSPTTWENGQANTIVSMAFNPTGSYAYLGQVSSGNLGATTLICSVDFNTGELTKIGSVKPATTGESNHMVVAPNGSFLFSVDSPFDYGDAFTINSSSGAITEIAGSPFPLPNNPFSLVVDPSGNYLYVVNQNEAYQTSYPPSQYDGSVSAFSINAASGALAPLAGSPYTDGINPTSIAIDPTGGFAYTAATKYTTGYTAFAQILGFSINSSTGVLTPFSSASFTDTVQSNGSQVAISSGPPAAPNPVPVISSLSPSSAVANYLPFVLQVNGSNFVPGAIVYFAGQTRATTYVSATQLTANMLGSDVDNSGTAVVFVFNPLPGGGPSTSVAFPVSAPAPVINSISPSNVTAAGPAFSLFAIGTGFITSSVINFNGTPLTTNFSGPTSIFAEITQAQIVAPGTATITVDNPSNGVAGGGFSNTVSLTIAPPNQQPILTSIYPPSGTAGGPAFTLTLTGSSFVRGATVSFNLISVPTTFVNSGQLTASIPASAIAISGSPEVFVTDPDGFASSSIPFTITPGLASLSPTSVAAGSNALNLNVIGTGFVSGSTVLVNSAARATTFMNSNLLVGMLQPSDLAQSGTLIVTVMNPPPGAGATGTLPLIVTGYNIAAATSSQTVSAGNTANFSLTLTPTNGTFGNSIGFSVSGLPTGAAATFSPPSIVLSGSGNSEVTLAISTTSRSTASSLAISRPAVLRGFSNREAAAVLLLLWGLLLPLFRSMWRSYSKIFGVCRERNPARSVGAMAMALVCLTAGLCGFQQGCSTSTTATPSAPAALPPSNIAGNWTFSTKSSVYPLQTTIAGAVAQSGANFSGSLNISGTTCDPAGTGSVSGTMTGSSMTASLVENEADNNSQTISLNGTVSPDGNSASGSYAAAQGGCTNGDTGTWAGTRAASVGNPNGTPAGTYSVTVNATSGSDVITTTVTLIVM